MKLRSFAAAGLSVVSAWAVAPAMAADVGVSVQISQPGIYGRVDIGRFPQPQVVVVQPVRVVQQRVVVVEPEPVYMWVPPGHRKHWRKHCGYYNACGTPVYFVQHGWYRDNVHYDERYDGPRQHPGKGHGKGKHKHGDRDDD